jgi:hypothetical protein
MKKNAVFFISSSYFGPYIIPSRLQNYCASWYAHENKINVKSIVNEGLYGENLSKLKFILLRDVSLEVIFVSVYQLNFLKSFSKFINDFGSRKFHFLLERRITHTKKDITNFIYEMKVFEKFKRIRTKDFNSYKELYFNAKKSIKNF